MATSDAVGDLAASAALGNLAVSVALGALAISVALGDRATTFFVLGLLSSGFALLLRVDLGLAGGFSLGQSSCFALLRAALGLTPALGLTDARGLTTPFLVGELIFFGRVDDGGGGRTGILARVGFVVYHSRIFSLFL
jgi:hypothetical protein